MPTAPALRWGKLRGSAAAPGLGAELVQAPVGSLDACTTGISDDVVMRSLEIVEDFRTSAREMVVCGGLFVTLVNSILDTIQRTLGKPVKNAFTYDGNGNYHAGPQDVGQTSMDVTVRLGADYAFGKKGDIVPADLTAASSYLVGAAVSLDSARMALSLKYRSTGPLVELLGFGSTPPNPLVVTRADAPRVQTELKKLVIDGTVRVVDTQGATKVSYEMKMPAKTVAEIAAVAKTGMIGAGDASRADLGQRLEVKTWEVSYIESGAKGLDGTIEFTVSGGAVSVVGRFLYMNSIEPRIELTCQ